MIKELTDSIKATLYQRVSSPLYGTYIISWLIYNWKYILPLCFGSNTFEQRLIKFQNNLTLETGGFAWHSITFPFLITIAILLLNPIVQRYIYIYSEWNRSEGLKKRDKFSAETMLTLEQSNELRASVQKIQQFHQEIIKNKDQEISEYKNQAESKQRSLNEKISSIQKLIGEVSSSERKNSEMSVEIAKLNDNINSGLKRYQKLSKLLSKQRRRTFSIRNRLTPKGWYANKNLLMGLPSLIEIEDSFSGQEYREKFDKLLALSSEKEWVHACHKLIIDGFSSSWSYNMADEYFDYLVKPHLNKFDEKNIDRLKIFWEENNQINGRRRAESDFKLVVAASDALA